MKSYIINLPVDNITLKEAVKKVEEFFLDSKPHFAVAINPEKIIKANSDKELFEIIRSSDLNFVDGVGISWAFRIFYHEKIKERITGIDLFSSLLESAEKNNKPVYFLGAEEETINKAVQNIKAKYPSIKIAGFHNGYFEKEEEIVKLIKNSNAEILFVGMGSPKQEKFIFKNLNKLGIKFSMGIGGSFNVFAGEFKRAPSLIQNMGMEWLYRFILDPKRLPRILSLPHFILLIMKKPKIVKEEVNFLNIKISNRSLTETLKVADKFIKSNNFHIVVTLNGEMAAKTFGDKDFFAILKRSDLVIPDGVGIVWGARRFGERIAYRIPGIDFAWEMLRLAEQNNYRIYLLGAKEDAINSAIKKIENEFPKINIVGYHSGYFDKASEEKIINEIKEKKVQILFVGMGGVKQEKWIWEHKDLNIPINIGIGGSFDIWSGKIKRAPRIVRKFGLEWLYRTIVQPSRILRAGNLFIFAFKIMFGKVER
jgi:N-acetylglucosaminyldiphosphoundecaprenol N-acetyl-beta-D-mannosaminyltransferase